MNILFVVTSVGQYPQCQIPTGLWLSELTHFYDVVRQAGGNITIASPQGGRVPIDPESLKPMLLDRLSQKYWENPDFTTQLKHSKSLNEIAQQPFDLIYLTGGHGTMFDFPNNPTLANILATHWMQGKKIAAICHGVGGLLNVKLPDGEWLIQDKSLTGFNWFEELLANRRKIVPFNLEEELKKKILSI